MMEKVAIGAFFTGKGQYRFFLSGDEILDNFKYYSSGPYGSTRGGENAAYLEKRKLGENRYENQYRLSYRNSNFFCRKPVCLKVLKHFPFVLLSDPYLNILDEGEFE